MKLAFSCLLAFLSFNFRRFGSVRASQIRNLRIPDVSMASTDVGLWTTARIKNCAVQYRIYLLLVGSRNILNRSVYSTMFPTVGRPKKFNRESVLEKALPVFWRCGFADTSLHELERATGVNKSGLYSEFKGKEDLFVQSLHYYVDNLELGRLLAGEPLGWDNIERFLKARPRNRPGLKGCFAVNSMRESAILPQEAIDIITQSRSRLKQLIAKNIEGEQPEAKANLLAELILTFFTGLRMEHNVSSSDTGFARKVAEFMKLIRKPRE